MQTSYFTFYYLLLFILLLLYADDVEVLSGKRCRLFAYGPADATAVPKPHHLFASFKFKSRLVLPFWYRLTQVVHEKRPLNGYSVVVVTMAVARFSSGGVVIIWYVLPVLWMTSCLLISHKAARRRRPSAEAQCTRSLGLGYKLSTVIPVAGQRTYGTTFRAFKVTS